MFQVQKSLLFDLEPRTLDLGLSVVGGLSIPLPLCHISQSFVASRVLSRRRAARQRRRKALKPLGFRLAESIAWANDCGTVFQRDPAPGFQLGRAGFLAGLRRGCAGSSFPADQRGRRWGPDL